MGSFVRRALSRAALSVLACALLATPGTAQDDTVGTTFQPACRQMSIDILEIGARENIIDQPALRGLGARGRRLSAPGIVIAVVDAGVSQVSVLDSWL